jgi:hypothetical protein
MTTLFISMLSLLVVCVLVVAILSGINGEDVPPPVERRK